MATITEDYISFETAKLLKEKGFNEDSWFHYDNDGDIVTRGYRLNHPDDIPAWTHQMAMKFLREEHNLFIEIQCYGCEADEKAHFEYSYVISEYVKKNNGICTIFGLEKRNAKSTFPSYEEACEAAIKYCLENLI